MGPRLRYAVVLVLLLAAACGDGSPHPERILTAAGEPVTAEAVVTTTTTTSAPATTTSTTRPPAPTTTAAPVVRTTAPRPAPAPAPVAAPPPAAGVEPWGYGGYGGRTSATAHGATAALQVYPRRQYFGEPVQVSVEVTSPSFITAKADMGNGTVREVLLVAKCSTATAPHTATGGAGFYVYPAPGQYVIRLLVTVIPCIAIPGPPGSPPGAPDPFERHTFEVAMAFEQRADRPPPPVGPPPGA